jgi:hypothetical protein
LPLQQLRRQQQQQQLTFLLQLVMPLRAGMRARVRTCPAAAHDPCHCLLLLVVVVWLYGLACYCSLHAYYLLLLHLLLGGAAVCLSSCVCLLMQALRHWSGEWGSSCDRKPQLLLLLLLWVLVLLLQQALVGQHAAQHACHPPVYLVSPQLQQAALHQHALLQTPHQTSFHCL